MSRAGGWVLLLLAACNAGPPAPAAKLWTVRDFLSKQGQALDFGGWLLDELMVQDGAALRFQAGTQAGGPGLTLFPAVTDGAVAAFAITDIWASHPQPWVQPVWIPLDANRERVPGVRNVFPVDVDSTFYSPFWRAEWLDTDQLDANTYRSARDVLSKKPVRRSGGVILCPLVPDATVFANDGTGPKEPASLQPLPKLPTQVSFAWVDGTSVSYLAFGLERAPAEGQTLVEAPAYFFVTGAGERPLPLAAVLPADATHHSLVRRVDVVLPEGAGPFVPSNRPELRTLLEARGVVVPLAPPSLDGFSSLALRVAANPDCFADPAFPAACDWLDSPARLEALPTHQRLVQPVQLAIGVVLP